MSVRDRASDTGGDAFCVGQQHYLSATGRHVIEESVDHLPYRGRAGVQFVVASCGGIEAASDPANL